MILFIVLGSFPVYLSYGDYFFADGFIRSANKISDKTEFSLFMNISLFVRNHSFIVRIILSILTFPLWSLIGHSTSSIYLFLQKSLNLLLRKIVAGSVLFFSAVFRVVRYIFLRIQKLFPCSVFVKI